MGSAAAILIDNQVDAGGVSASSQALTMPAANLKTPHPSERWRSLSRTAWLMVDKRTVLAADTVMVGGMTCGPNTTARLRLSSADSSGNAGDVLDVSIANGDQHFDTTYGSLVYRLPAPQAWRYTRIDINDPDASYIEAGFIVDGLSEAFEVNFSYGGAIQYVDRSRVASTAAGLSLTWKDNTFRRVDLKFDWINPDQRFGVIERLDRVKGRHQNILLMTDPDGANLPRASVWGLVTDLTPVTFVGIDIFGKQLRIDERL